MSTFGEILSRNPLPAIVSFVRATLCTERGHNRQNQNRQRAEDRPYELSVRVFFRNPYSREAHLHFSFPLHVPPRFFRASLLKRIAVPMPQGRAQLSAWISTSLGLFCQKHGPVRFFRDAVTGSV